MTREEIEIAIAAITTDLKGPLSNLDRMMLIEDRADLRQMLAMFDPPELSYGATKEIVPPGDRA